MRRTEGEREEDSENRRKTEEGLGEQQNEKRRRRMRRTGLSFFTPHFSFLPCLPSLLSLLISPPPHLVSNLLPLLFPQSSLPFLSDPSATSSPASLPCSSFHAPRFMQQMQNTIINIETPGKGDQKVRKRMNSCPPLAPCDRQWGMPRIMMPCTIF